VPARTLIQNLDDTLRSIFLRSKVIPDDAATYNWNANMPAYLNAVTVQTRGDLSTSLISMAACADGQDALDGNQHGLFTQELLDVWNSGGYLSDYPDFMNSIGQYMPDTETPQYRTVGAPWPAFENQQPFSVAPPAGYY
jgi:hypothetical protein